MDDSLDIFKDTFSIIMHKTDVRLIGLSFSAIFLDPFLYIGIIRPIFQSSGRAPLSREKLKTV